MNRPTPASFVAAHDMALGIKWALEAADLDNEQWHALWLLKEELEQYAEFLAYLENMLPAEA